MVKYWILFSLLVLTTLTQAQEPKIKLKSKLLCASNLESNINLLSDFRITKGLSFEVIEVHLSINPDADPAQLEDFMEALGERHYDGLSFKRRVQIPLSLNGPRKVIIEVLKTCQSSGLFTKSEFYERFSYRQSSSKVQKKEKQLLDIFLAKQSGLCENPHVFLGFQNAYFSEDGGLIFVKDQESYHKSKSGAENCLKKRFPNYVVKVVANGNSVPFKHPRIKSIRELTQEEFPLDESGLAFDLLKKTEVKKELSGGLYSRVNYILKDSKLSTPFFVYLELPKGAYPHVVDTTGLTIRLVDQRRSFALVEASVLPLLKALDSISKYRIDSKRLNQVGPTAFLFEEKQKEIALKRISIAYGVGKRAKNKSRLKNLKVRIKVPEEQQALIEDVRVLEVLTSRVSNLIDKENQILFERAISKKNSSSVDFLFSFKQKNGLPFGFERRLFQKEPFVQSIVFYENSTSRKIPVVFTREQLGH